MYHYLPSLDSDMIVDFSGKHDFLWPGHESSVLVEGIWFPTVLHAYCAERARNWSDFYWLRDAASIRELYQRVHKIDWKSDWDSSKRRHLERIISSKFAQNQELAEALENTGNSKGEITQVMVGRGVCNRPVIDL